MKYIIVAYDKNRLIGANNSLLWQGVMEADIRHFREKTTNGVIIMGRKTYYSIGRPLPNRQNIVITHQALVINGVQVVHSLEEAYKQADVDKPIYIIGGGQLYSEALTSVDKIIVTEIHASFVGDIYFPKLSNNWIEASRQDHLADSKNKYDYSFITYTKRQ